MRSCTAPEKPCHEVMQKGFLFTGSLPAATGQIANADHHRPSHVLFYAASNLQLPAQGQLNRTKPRAAQLGN